MWTGWDTLDPTRLAAFDAHEFEDLISDLLDVEARDRWRQGDYVPEGPPKPCVADGGRDLSFTAKQAPRRSADAYCTKWGLGSTLIGDLEPGQTLVISAKTGSSYKQSLIADTKHGTRVIEVLAKGGLFVAFVSKSLPTRPPANDDTAADRSEHDALRDHLAQAYAERLQLAGKGAGELRQCIRVVDGHDIVRFIRRRRPIELRDASLTKLGLRRIAALHDREYWAASHQRDRSLPTFERDEARGRIIAQLQAYVAPSAGVAEPIVLFGPPGIGKSRLVMEALDLSKGAAIADDVDEVVAELSTQNLLRSAPSIVLVVDDCPPHCVERLLQRFRQAQADEPAAVHARLLVIVPQGDVSPHDAERWRNLIEIRPLGPEARLALIRQEVDDNRAEAIDRCTEGYPWFAVLVAREVRDGAATPVSTTHAARIALVGREKQGTRDQIRKRARALLGLLLAGSPRWNDLTDEAKDQIAHAVDHQDRHALDDELKACVDRGLVRATRRWYMTPKILEREVCRIASEKPDPGGPILARIKKHCPERLAAFLQRLREMDLDEDLLGTLAEPLAAELAISVRTLDDLDAASAASLVFCARHSAAASLSVVAGVIDHASAEELRARADLRRPLMYALTSVSRRAPDFVSVERSLFRLRVTENETYANNATATWVQLFLPAVDLALAPYAERFAILKQRCQTGPVEERLSAVRGLADLVDARGGGLVVLDGVPLRYVDVHVAGERVIDCWRLLIALTGDPVSGVAELAEAEIVEHLSYGADRGFLDDLAGALVTAARGFSERGRLALRNRLHAWRSFRDKQDRPLHPLWEQLDAASRAASFVQRLRDRLCSRPTFGRSQEQDAFDADLIREGLQDNAAQLLQHLDELVRPEAERSEEFMVALGSLDTAAVLREPLLARTRANQKDRLLSAWAFGQWRQARYELVRELVDTAASEDALVHAAVLTMVRIGLDDAWVDKLEKLARESGLPDTTMRLLTHVSWERASRANSRRLLTTLMDVGGETAAQVVMEYCDNDARAALDQEDLVLMERSLRRVSAAVFTGHAAWTFYQCGMRLLEGGRAPVACEVALAASSHEQLPGDGVWELVGECARRAPPEFWLALSRRLDDPASGRDWLRGRLYFHDVSAGLPVDMVMHWVGQDEPRGCMIAPIVSFAGDDLPGTARELLRRFGATSEVAHALTGRFLSTVDFVRSMAAFYGDRLARLELWSQDGDVAIRFWAQSMMPEVRKMYEAKTEDEAIDRRRYGT